MKIFYRQAEYTEGNQVFDLMDKDLIGHERKAVILLVHINLCHCLHEQKIIFVFEVEKITFQLLIMKLLSTF